MKEFKIKLSPSVIYYQGLQEVKCNQLILKEVEVLDFFKNLKVSKDTFDKDNEQRKIFKIYNALNGKSFKKKSFKDGAMRSTNVTSKIKIKDTSFQDISVKEVK